MRLLAQAGSGRSLRENRVTSLANAKRPQLTERDAAECFRCGRTFKSAYALFAHRVLDKGGTVFICLPPTSPSNTPPTVSIK
jgi:hypothetical protein